MPRKGYLQIKVSASEHETLRRLAAESQVTVSDWIRGAILAKTMRQSQQAHNIRLHELEPATVENYKLLAGVTQTPASHSADSELESIRQELRAPDFEYLQLLFVPGNPARSLELWCRTKAVWSSSKREWYLKRAERIAELRNRTQNSS
jgi:hypothetical protein